METELTDLIYQLCMKLPVPLDDLKNLCKKATPQDLGLVACKYANDCFLERRDFVEEKGKFK